MQPFHPDSPVFEKFSRPACRTFWVQTEAKDREDRCNVAALRHIRVCAFLCSVLQLLLRINSHSPTFSGERGSLFKVVANLSERGRESVVEGEGKSERERECEGLEKRRVVPHCRL